MLEARFHSLFSGLDRAYGTYTTSGNPIPGQKHLGQARTYQADVTDELWRNHLAGDRGIGIIPICDDATCRWGAIDIDVYDNFSIADFEAQCAREKLPLVLCRTKSGGCHAYLFLKAPAPAAHVRHILASWAQALGYGSSEIFPKQDRLAGPDDCGSWINMPYFGGDSTRRFAILDGEPLSSAAFLELAESRMAPIEELTTLTLATEEELSGAPPCLQTLCTQGEPSAGLHLFAFNLGIYVKIKYADKEPEEQAELMRTLIGKYAPSFPAENLESAIIKSVQKKDYFYRCKEPPLKGVCNKTLCRTCKHGIGCSGLEIKDLEKYGTEGAVYHLTVNGQRMRLKCTEDLIKQQRFHLACVEQIVILPDSVKEPQWRALVQSLLEDCIIVEAPDEVGQEGLFVHLLSRYIGGSFAGEAPECLLNGQGWSDGSVFRFLLNDLVLRLEQDRFQAVKAPVAIATYLKKLGAVEEEITIRGKPMHVWAVPLDAFAAVTEKFDDKVDKPAF